MSHARCHGHGHGDHHHHHNQADAITEITTACNGIVSFASTTIMLAQLIDSTFDIPNKDFYGAFSMQGITVSAAISLLLTVCDRYIHRIQNTIHQENNQSFPSRQELDAIDLTTAQRASLAGAYAGDTLALGGAAYTAIATLAPNVSTLSKGFQILTGLGCTLFGALGSMGDFREHRSSLKINNRLSQQVHLNAQHGPNYQTLNP